MSEINKQIYHAIF